MARVKEVYEFEDALKKDELEEREDKAVQSKRKRRKRRIRLKRLLLLLIIFVLGVYLISDFSNIRIVELKGNHYYTKQQIMRKANIAYSMKSLLAPSWLIEKRLEDDEMIASATVDKSWDGIISIVIKEEKLAGYYQKNNQNFMIVDEEKDVLIEDESRLYNVPFIVDLNEVQRNEYKKKIKAVESENLYLISEIFHYETSYDQNMLKLMMQDGHIVYTSMEGLPLLNQYKEMLKGLNTDLKCVTFAEESNTMYTEKCE